MKRLDLPVVIVDDRTTLPAALQRLTSGDAYAVVYIDDWPGRPGQMFVRTFLAKGYEQHQPALDEFVRRSVERSGCTVVDADELARLGKRGVA